MTSINIDSLTIAGFITPASGSIKFGDRDVTSIPTHKRNIGMVFQDYALFPDKSVNTNVAYGLKARKVPKSEIPARIQEALERVGMADRAHHRPSEMSGGQQQRVAIARAIATHPPIIMADEPTGALDSRTGREVLAMLQDIHRQGNTVVLITHDNSIAVQAQRIIRLEDGHVVYDGDATAPEAVVTPRAAGRFGGVPS